MSPAWSMALAAALLLAAGCGNCGDDGAKQPQPVPASKSDAGRWPIEMPSVPPPDDMVPVPAGPFIAGCTMEPRRDCGSVEDSEVCCSADIPPRSIETTGSFEIDRRPVSARDYAACHVTSACPWPSRFEDDIELVIMVKENYPTIPLTYAEAETYCRWVGKRLPSGREWEKAVRGTDGRTFPWGNEGRLYYWPEERPTSEPPDISPYGVEDAMQGIEWVTDTIDRNGVARGGRGVWEISSYPRKDTSDARCARSLPGDAGADHTPRGQPPAGRMDRGR